MNVLEFHPDHLKRIEAAGGRKIFGDGPFTVEHAELCAEHPAWSLFADGRIIGCGGIFREHETCGTAWTMLLPDTGKHMRWVTRETRRVLDDSFLTRIQAHASPKFRPAARWLALLGFKYEGLLRKYTPTGADMWLFARVR